MRFSFLILSVSLLTACGEISPHQGPGAMWIYERGEAICVNVESVTFVASRWTKYVEQGESKSTRSPIDYRRGESCQS